MEWERPYTANYVSGCLLGMGLYMIFNMAAVIIYPEAYETDVFKIEEYQMLFAILSVSMIILSVCIFLGSGLAYKLSFLVIGFSFYLAMISLFENSTNGFDLWTILVLTISCFLLLLMPSMRHSYNNWSLPFIPQYELE